MSPKIWPLVAGGLDGVTGRSPTLDGWLGVTERCSDGDGRAGLRGGRASVKDELHPAWVFPKPSTAPTLPAPAQSENGPATPCRSRRSPCLPAPNSLWVGQVWAATELIRPGSHREGHTLLCIPACRLPVGRCMERPKDDRPRDLNGVDDGCGGGHRGT